MLMNAHGVRVMLMIELLERYSKGYVFDPLPRYFHSVYLRLNSQWDNSIIKYLLSVVSICNRCVKFQLYNLKKELFNGKCFSYIFQFKYLYYNFRGELKGPVFCVSACVHVYLLHFRKNRLFLI